MDATVRCDRAGRGRQIRRTSFKAGEGERGATAGTALFMGGIGVRPEWHLRLAGKELRRRAGREVG